MPFISCPGHALIVSFYCRRLTGRATADIQPLNESVMDRKKLLHCTYTIPGTRHGCSGDGSWDKSERNERQRETEITLGDVGT